MSLGEKVLNIDKNRGFRLWHFDEIYMGPEGTGKYVPNLNDAVLNWNHGLFVVTYVDPTTYVPTLEKMNPALLTGVVDDTTALGVGPGHISENFRLFVNTTTNPATIVVENVVPIYGSDTRKVKIFHGSDISENGKIISARYDQNGTLIDNALLLEDVDPGPEGSRAIKKVRSGHTTWDLHDGELVTLVAYNDIDVPSYIVRLLVKNTNFVARGDAPIKHVTGVRLVSPFLSKTDPDVLNYPLNLPLRSMQVEAVVEYSDGTSKKHNVDGTSFTLHGLDNYLPSIVGQKIPLTLTYRLDSDESTFTEAGTTGTVSKSYTAITVDESNIYNVKLFVAPQWQDDVRGYKLRFFLYNIDRDISTDVTDNVTFDTVNRMAFQPTFYGSKQSVAAVINLQDVSPTYMNYKHIQPFDITLLAPAHERPEPWLIDYNSDGEYVYGTGIHADFESNIEGGYDVIIFAGHVEFNHWLNDAYFRTDPMLNRATEGEPVTPSHMRIRVDETEVYRPVSEWRSPIKVDFLPNSRCKVDIFWVKETGLTTLELGQSTFNMYVNE